MKNSTLQLIQRMFLISCLLLISKTIASGQEPADKESANTSFDLPVRSGTKVYDLKSAQETMYTSNFTMTNTDVRVVPDMDLITYRFTPTVDIPSSAKVTSVLYSITIDDNGNEMNFFPKNYEIWLSSGSHGGYTYKCVYNNQGFTLSNVDEGFDDDAENDTDIRLSLRTSHDFDGENADQFYTVMVSDNVSGGVGKVTSVSLMVYYEAPNLPNLDVDRTPPGWSAPIVVSSSSGSHTQTDIVYANTDYYMGFALYNSSDYAVSSNFVWEFNIAGHISNFTVTYPIPAHELYPMHNTWQFEAGTRSVCTRADPANTLAESNESDNEHCITLNVIGVPVAPALSSPADHATCQATDITFSWSTAAYATSYNFQLDDNADFSSPVANVDQAATSRSYEGLSPGTKYYWRIRSYNPAGYGSYSETRSFTNSPGAPGIPSLSSPSNSAGCQSTSLKLNWQDASNASSYALQLDNNSDFGSPLINESGIDISEYNVTGLSAGGTYYWKVSSSSGCKSSTWSSVYSFKVAETPSVPSLTSPSGAASCQPTSLTLSWNSVSGAASYDIVVDNNPELGSPLVNQNVLTASYAVSGLSEGTTYYWAVRAKNSCGVYSAWCEPRPFTTLVPAATVPSPASPTHLANCQPLSLSLSWNEVAHASGYSLQVDNNDDFGSLVVNQTGIASTAYTVSGLNPGTTYFWRVLSTSACGGSSSWSGVRSFTTASNPAVPALAGPDNVAGCQALNLTLSWNSVSGAVSYDIRVDDNSDFSSPVVNQTDVTATSISVSELSAGTTYNWAVRAKNSCGIYSSWSDSRSFATAASTPDAPAAIAPSDEASCQDVSITLDWSDVIGAGTYTLQVDDNNDFSSPLFNQGSLASTSQPVEGLSEGTNYYWRTKAVNSCGVEGPWSSGNSFATLISSFATPVLTGPANSIECQPVNLTLSWENVPNATSYSLQVDNNSDFSSPDYLQSCAGTNHNCSSLSESTLYYWRVSASGSCSVTGSWSDVRSFKTGSGGMTAPSLTTPADSSNGEPLSLTLSWGSVTNATGYRFQLDDNEDFASPLYNEDITANSKVVSGLTEKTTYFWQVRANGTCSASNWSEVRKFETLTIPSAIYNEESNGYALKQNFPNPFTGITTVEFSIPVDCEVSIEFINMQGMIIETCYGYYPAGEHGVRINLNDKAHAGVYIYRMRTLDFVDTKLCIFR
jgi:hypothetical protein